MMPCTAMIITVILMTIHRNVSKVNFFLVWRLRTSDSSSNSGGSRNRYNVKNDEVARKNCYWNKKISLCELARTVLRKLKYPQTERWQWGGRRQWRLDCGGSLVPRILGRQPVAQLFWFRDSGRKGVEMTFRTKPNKTTVQGVPLVPARSTYTLADHDRVWKTAPASRGDQFEIHRQSH